VVGAFIWLVIIISKGYYSRVCWQQSESSTATSGGIISLCRETMEDFISMIVVRNMVTPVCFMP
jgi:hypothetical protein